MEKTEDFNVLELQELAIKHNCGKKHTSSPYLIWQVICNWLKSCNFASQSL